MPINSPNDCIFEPEATALMGDAFEAACEGLHFPKHKWARELLASRIIAAARRGELDPDRLHWRGCPPAWYLSGSDASAFLPRQSITSRCYLS
jgi:hypothetical protein